MLYPKSKIGEHLLKLGITPGETIMLHGDAGVTSQFIYDTECDPIDQFFSELKSYFCGGTILVPTFTYSATKGEVFDLHDSPSEVGLFSEKFRVSQGVQRSCHPIFSISAFGKDADKFLYGRSDDCFGEGTFFAKLYEENVKIVTLGCPLDRVTFVHYVEQDADVPYRYFKNFNAKIVRSGVEEVFDVRYFVRDLAVKKGLDLSAFESEALRENKIRVEPFGRFKARCISSKNFDYVAKKLLKENEYALLGGDRL